MPKARFPRQHGLVGAVQFLTRIPMRTRSPVPHERQLAWFPVVGAIVGLSVGGVFAGAGQIVDAPIVAATLAVVSGLLITGAFHEDGLADMADAVAGGATREHRLAILHDPRHGTYGVAALASSMLLRVVTLASMSPAVGLAGAVSAHTLGRTAAVCVIGRVPAARPRGLGATAAETVGEPSRSAGATVGLAVAVVATGWWASVTIPAAAVAAAVVTVVAVRAFGGINGDVLGAIEQLGEVVVLIAVLAVAEHHELWWR